MIAADRVAAARKRMLAEKVDALAVIRPVNARYLTGFDRVFDDEMAHIALVTQDATTLFTDGRYAESAGIAAEGTDWVVQTISEDLDKTVADAVAKLAPARIAVEDSIAQRRYGRLSELFSAEVVAASSWVEEIRQVKEPAEIERIAAAQQLTDATFDHILEFVSVGMTEREIGLELEMFMRKNGSDGIAFAPIVASGPNSARPHAQVSERAVERGELLKMDFGARVDGYCSDMTRTIVMGQASDWQREFYSAVLAGNLAGIAAVKAGVLGSEVDGAARAVIAEHGLGELFTHGLGHGVGLEIHELPNLGMRSTKELPAGAVVTVEPGVYAPGRGGVRIEDLVVVEEGSARVLTTSTKDLIEL